MIRLWQAASALVADGYGGINANVYMRGKTNKGSRHKVLSSNGGCAGYYVNTSLYMKNIQDFISLVFFLDYVLHVYCEPATLHYVFSVRGIVELLSFVPLAFLFNGPGKGSRFIHLLQLLRIVRIFSCLGEIGIVGSTATQQIILLVVATIGVVFLDAGILQWLENGFSAEMKTASNSLTYWQSFYFLIVTVATVGYGDVVPTTAAGQILAVLSIIGTVVVLPSQIGKISSVASRRPYGQSFSSWRIVDSRFVIISGSVKLRIIHEFLSELFNPAHHEDMSSRKHFLCMGTMSHSWRDPPSAIQI
ncbi:hypothetical protein L7F22_034974 [Adiantum nelumboides]|nr:hypothetical protein [Adiantum nelumboides]